MAEVEPFLLRSVIVPCVQVSGVGEQLPRRYHSVPEGSIALVWSRIAVFAGAADVHPPTRRLAVR
jgi:hypothetical protein